MHGEEYIYTGFPIPIDNKRGPAKRKIAEKKKKKKGTGNVGIQGGRQNHKTTLPNYLKAVAKGKQYSHNAGQMSKYTKVVSELGYDGSNESKIISL